MNLKFRSLRADEVDARVAMVKKNGVSILLYKDARCDQNVLDETVGPLNWQRHHTRDNANCIVSIWDEDKKQWIEKEDTGTESYTEKEKGLASDSFKRACFNFGIGRELYTAPFIWVPADKCKIEAKGSGFTCYDRFSVRSMAVENGKITQLTVWNDTQRRECFSWGKPSQKAPQPASAPRTETDEEINERIIDEANAQRINGAKWAVISRAAANRGISQRTLLNNNGLSSPSQMTFKQWNETMKWLDTLPETKKGTTV